MKHFLFFMCVGLFLFTEPALAEIKTNKYKSPFSLQIKLDKKEFRVGETVEGVITITNKYMSSLPAIFIVRLFKEDKVYTEVFTSAQAVPLGVTKFRFKEFGIPHFNTHPGTEGKWKISIVQQSMENSDGVEAILTIVPPAIKQETEHTFIKRKFKY